MSDRPEVNLEKTIPGIKKLNAKEKDQLVQIIQSIQTRQETHYSGPIPPSSEMEGYNKAFTNGAERIFNLAEKQAYHRMQLETIAIKAQLDQSSLGQKFAFITFVILAAIGVTLTFYGYERVAIVIFSGTIIGVVSLFIFGKKKSEK